MNDISDTEKVEKNNVIEYLTARDEVGGKVQIPYRSKSEYAYPKYSSSSRFISSGVREKTTSEEFIPIAVDSRLKPEDVIDVKDELGSSFYYQITEKPTSASTAKKEDHLLVREDIYLKRLTKDEFNKLKDKEVPIVQKETEIKMNNQLLKNITVEMEDSK